MKIKTLKELEKEQILKVLEKTYWNMEMTARLLHISVSQLKRKTRKYGINREGPGLGRGDSWHNLDLTG